MSWRQVNCYAIQILSALLGAGLYGMFLAWLYGSDSDGWMWGWQLMVLFGAWLGFKYGECLADYIDYVFSEPRR